MKNPNYVIFDEIWKFAKLRLQKLVASFFSLQIRTLTFKKQILCESGLKQRYFPDECFWLGSGFMNMQPLLIFLGHFSC